MAQNCSAVTSLNLHLDSLTSKETYGYTHIVKSLISITQGHDSLIIEILKIL